MIQGKRAKQIIDDILQNQGEPYLDVCLTKGQKRIFRYYKSNCFQATGKEVLYLYSCTKPVTVCCAMRLIEEGKIQLDEPVSKYFPEYADAFLSEDGVRIPINREITVRQLFTM